MFIAWKSRHVAALGLLITVIPYDRSANSAAQVPLALLGANVLLRA
jgi:hypothetical protein